MPDESETSPDAGPPSAAPPQPGPAAPPQQRQRRPAWYFALADAIRATRAPLITAIAYLLIVAVPDQCAEAVRIMLGWRWYYALPAMVFGWWGFSFYLAAGLASLAARALGLVDRPPDAPEVPLIHKLLVLFVVSAPFLAGFIALRPLQLLSGEGQVGGWVFYVSLAYFGALSGGFVLPLLAAALQLIGSVPERLLARVRGRPHAGPKVLQPVHEMFESISQLFETGPWMTLAAAGMFVAWLVVWGVLDLFFGIYAETPTLLFLPLWATLLCAGLVLLVWLSEKTHRPVLMPALLWVLLLSSCDVSDNHEVLHSRLPPTAAAVAPPPVDQAFAAWLDARAPEVARWNAAGRNFPVLLVAAEGGGARAAYFTALVMEELRARCPRLLRHTFLMAGVSGGSLGAALVAASAHAAGPGAAAADCPGAARDAGSGVVRDAGLGVARDDALGARAEATRALEADLLSPVVRGTLIPDLVARLFPTDLGRLLPEGQLRRAWDGWIRRPVTELTDRARYLERAVDRAWWRATGRDLESLPFGQVWRGPGGAVPALMLLTTDVATGRRVAVSHLAMPGGAPPLAEGCAPPPGADAPVTEIARMRSLAEEVPGIDLPLPTAALLSARFTLLSPAGTLPCPGPRRRLVDGGYFENSGLTTMLDVVDALRAAIRDRRVTLVILRIENSRATTNADSVAGAPPPPPSSGLSELASPVRALLATREARGEQAREAELTPCVEIGEVAFTLSPGCVPIPLGWSLSDGARREMQEQLLGRQSPSAEVCAALGAPGRAQNPLAMADVFRLLAPPP